MTEKKDSADNVDKTFNFNLIYDTNFNALQTARFEAPLLLIPEALYVFDNSNHWDTGP